jgi:outer membrane receptor protein involved in Fe transport
MTRLSTFVAPAAVLVLVTLAAPAAAQQSSVKIPKAQITLARASLGSIQGVVLDSHGQPLAGAMVSALGSTVAFALSGRDGRFGLDALPMGAYTVRVHRDGFSPSRRQIVHVRSGASSTMLVALEAPTSSTANNETLILTAGLSPFDAAPATVKVPAFAGDEAGEGSTTDTAWRLRHLKRSVLKSTEGGTLLAGGVEPIEPATRGTVWPSNSSFRPAGGALAHLPLTGQFNFVTTGSVSEGPSRALPADVTAASLAYMALNAPMGRWGEWTMRGAVRQGELGSWFLAGSYSGRPAGNHRVSGGLAYGTQLVEPLTSLGPTTVESQTRSMASAYAVDDWTISRRVSLSYALAYVWQNYVTSGALMSPRVSLTLTPTRHYRVRAIVARSETAPGADELLPSGSTLDVTWLPTQRSFSPWADSAPFRPQSTNHVELAVERVARDFVLGFRSFYQRVDNQTGTVFTTPALERPTASAGHYYVATVGDASARGWGVSLASPTVAGVRGSVDYSQTTAAWSGFENGIAAPAWFATGAERIHDLTASLETSIPFTATHVYVLYRINTAFAHDNAQSTSDNLNGRFDVQVNQSLPFMDFTSAEWDVLVAVRNVFRDPVGEHSVFDELLVVKPPTRIVGGVRVRF